VDLNIEKRVKKPALKLSR